MGPVSKSKKIEIHLGKSLKEIEELIVGQMIELEEKPTEGLFIVIDGKRVAKCSIFVVDNSLAVRVDEILS